MLMIRCNDWRCSNKTPRIYKLMKCVLIINARLLSKYKLIVIEVPWSYKGKLRWDVNIVSALAELVQYKQTAKSHTGTPAQASFNMQSNARGALVAATQRARPNVKQFYAKNIVLLTSLSAINVITRPENYHLSCKFQYEIESVRRLYDCAKQQFCWIALKILMNYGNQAS